MYFQYSCQTFITINVSEQKTFPICKYCSNNQSHVHRNNVILFNHYIFRLQTLNTNTAKIVTYGHASTERPRDGYQRRSLSISLVAAFCVA